LFFPASPTYLLMIIPAIALFTFFIIYPTINGMFYSFTDYVGYGAWKFIGFANYKAAFSDPNIRDSYGFTLLFAVVGTLVVNVTAMLLALALNSQIKWQRAFRTLFFLPMVISGLVISYVFTFIISNSIPIVSAEIHFTPFTSSLLANQHLAWLGVVFVASWQAIPGAIIIFLAGLVAIPTEVYEAASIDGASAWSKFRHMTFPLLFPFFIINSVLVFKNFLNVYDVVVGLTGGGPGTATTSVAQTIFNGFFNGDYAYQMANAVLFFIVTVVLSILQLGVIRRRGGGLI
jgi:raffinose/stachyose/melibiose transport system permease protein